jgi:hypothetical protein
MEWLRLGAGTTSMQYSASAVKRFDIWEKFRYETSVSSVDNAKRRGYPQDVQ